MKLNSKSLLTAAVAVCLSAAMASTASAALDSLLPDPTAYVTSEDWGSGPLANLWAGDHTGTYLIGQADIGWQPSGDYGGAAIATGSDSDGYAGDTINSHTIVFDMGSEVTFGGFLHAQRHQAAGDSVKTIQFWVTNTDPGSDTTAIANTYFGTTPHASKDLIIGNRHLHSYEFGTDLTGRYVVMRWISNGTANPGGYVFQLGTVAVTGGVDAGVSTLDASPIAVPANGATTSTITVTLMDVDSNPVSGKLVSLANTAGQQAAVITAVNPTTNVNGVATFTVKSTTVGTEEFTATDVDDTIVITQKASVEFTTPVVDAGTSTVAASPASVPANGSIFSLITVTLLDSGSQPVPGKTVTLAGDTGNATISLADPGQTATDSNGRLFFSVKSTFVGTEVFTATNVTDGSMLITDNASVEFTTVDPNAFVVLGDPISSSTSNAQASFPVGNLYDGSPTFADVGTSANLGGKYIASGTDSDGITGKGHVVVYDMGATASFNAFLYAQRKNTVVDAVGTIEFWATDTNPGNASTTNPLPIISTTPDATVEITFTTDEVLHDYYLDGTLTGRYVVMRMIAHPSATGATGGYELVLGQGVAPSGSDYDTWALGYPGLGAAGDDDDGDGLTNDEERIFGLNPQSGASANPISVPLNVGNGTFSYTRRNPSFSNLTYTVWTSTNLKPEVTPGDGGWAVDAGAVQTPGAPDSNGVQTVGVQVSASLFTGPKLFIRVVAQ